MVYSISIGFIDPIILYGLLSPHRCWESKHTTKKGGLMTIPFYGEI